MKVLALLFINILGAIGCAQAPVAPELVGSKWLNTQDEKPITLASRKGKVTLVHFWTFACGNCHANLPAYERLIKKYKAQGVEMIGIHTPELELEKDEAKLAAAIKKWKISYPVLVDGQGQNWANWKQQVWPTIYVIDQKGEVAYYWVGELAWKGARGEQEVSRVVDRLLSQK
jgi:thiol-disulfide isomerase/thioredoxin